MPANKNLFIVLEGIDHCGKTTISDRLADELDAVRLNFPDRNTVSGKIINEYLQSKKFNKNINKESLKMFIKLIKNGDYSKEIKDIANLLDDFENGHNYSTMFILQCLFSINRYEKVNFIKETLKSKSIICDRYWISGAVYSTAKGLDYNFCKEMDSKLPKPDIILFLDVNTEITMKRTFGDESHDVKEFQDKVYSLYTNIKEDMTFIKNDTIECMVNDCLNKINKLYL